MEQSELEVTGISRSGRVRKKSSKLTDFESIDEGDRHRKKNEKMEPFPSPGNPHKGMSPLKKPIKVEVPSEEEDNHMEVTNYAMKEEVHFSESDSEMGMFNTNDSSLDSLGSEVDDDDLEDHMGLDNTDHSQVSEGFQRINLDSPDTGGPTQAQSLYMLEKSSKKKLIIRDGRIVGRAKAQRKDKGDDSTWKDKDQDQDFLFKKPFNFPFHLICNTYPFSSSKTRFTAYMLWAKEIRQELMRANPELDFSQTSKKLGELWATVPYNEKYIWKRRAKRMASKGAPPPVKEYKSVGVVLPSPKKRSPPTRKFINKQAGGSGSAGQQSAGSATVSPPDHPVRGSRSTLVADPVVGPGLYKVVGTTPIDVSAHLRLLGESLTIIGERLKEHEGQIAVSGSLSVLLDSLLCALGPLLCLTQQVPSYGNACPPPTLSKILDHIAYIMPGL